MTRARARSRRAQMALAACVLWLAGVELLPAVHEGLHGRLAAHRHDAGSIVVASFEDTTHRHPDGSIHYVTRAPSPARAAVTEVVTEAVTEAVPEALIDGPRGASAETDRADRADRADEVGAHAGGLAHHAAALAPVAPPVTQPLPIDRRPIALVVERAIELVAQDPLAASARGPPIA